MQTEILAISSDHIFCTQALSIKKLRLLNEEEWMEFYGSSTLKRAKKLGATWKDLYRHERIAFEFGHAWRYLPRSRVIFGDAFTEGDCPSVTEAQWLADRYIARKPFPEDYFEYKYLRVSESTSSQIEEQGLGLILRKTSASFIGEGNIVFCFLTLWDEQSQTWSSVINPC